MCARPRCGAGEAGEFSANPNPGERQAGVLLLGLFPADVPLPGGCRLAVDEFLAILVAPSDGTGFGSTLLPIPDDLALPGASFYAQWFVLDAQGALLNQASSTRGIRVRLGG
jgi:hypothetical protein